VPLIWSIRTFLARYPSWLQQSVMSERGVEAQEETVNYGFLKSTKFIIFYSKKAETQVVVPAVTFAFIL